MSHTTMKPSGPHFVGRSGDLSASKPISSTSSTFKSPTTPSHHHHRRRRRTGSTIKRNRGGSISFSSSPLSQPPFMNYTNPPDIWSSPQQVKTFGEHAKKELPTGPPPQNAFHNQSSNSFLDDMSSTSLVVPDLDFGLPSSEADWPATPRPDVARFSPIPEPDQFSSSAFRSFAQKGHKRMQSGSNVDPSLLLSNGSSDANSRLQYFTAYPDASAFDFSAMMNSPDCLPRSHRTRNFLSSSRALYLPPDIKKKNTNPKTSSNEFTIGLCINEDGKATLYSKLNDEPSLMSRILDNDHCQRKKKRKVGSGPLVMMGYMGSTQGGGAGGGGLSSIPAHKDVQDDDDSSYESDSDAETEVGISCSKIPTYKSMSNIFSQTASPYENQAGSVGEVDARMALAKAFGHKFQPQHETKQHALLRKLENFSHNSSLLSATEMFDSTDEFPIFEDACSSPTPASKKSQSSLLAAGPKMDRGSSDTENHAPDGDDAIFKQK